MTQAQQRILGLMDNFYYFLADKLPARQDNLFRTYLWVASLVVSTGGFSVGREKFDPESASGMLCIAAIISAAAALLVCLHAMRGKQSLQHPDLREYIHLAEADENALSGLVDHFWDIIGQEITLKSLRGRRLRDTSQLLSVAVVFLGLSWLILLG